MQAAQMPQLPATRIADRPSITAIATRPIFVCFATLLTTTLLVAYSTVALPLLGIWNSPNAAAVIENLVLRLTCYAQGQMFEAIEVDRIREYEYKEEDGWEVTWLNEKNDQGKYYDVKAVQRDKVTGVILNIHYIEVKSTMLSYIKKNTYQVLSGAPVFRPKQRDALNTPPDQQPIEAGVQTEFKLHILFFALGIESATGTAIFVSVTDANYWLSERPIGPALGEQARFNSDQIPLETDGSTTGCCRVRLAHINALFAKFQGPGSNLPQLEQVLEA